MIQTKRLYMILSRVICSYPVCVYYVASLIRFLHYSFDVETDVFKDVCLENVPEM